MSAKINDQHGRWRSKAVAFRLSPEEDMALDQLVAISGMTKQDYIISRLMNKDIVVTGNPRIFKGMKDILSDTLKELKLCRGNQSEQELLETINAVSKALNSVLALSPNFISAVNSVN